MIVIFLNLLELFPLFKLQGYQLDTKMVRTQIAGASSKGCEFVIFEPNLDGLEEKC